VTRMLKRSKKEQRPDDVVNVLTTRLNDQTVIDATNQLLAHARGNGIKVYKINAARPENIVGHQVLEIVRHDLADHFPWYAHHRAY